MPTRKTRLTIPKDHLHQEKNIIKMSKKGASKTAIQRELKLPANFFSQYPQALEWFYRGRDMLAREVSKKVIGASTESYLDRKLLVEKLNLFQEPFKTVMLKTPKDARDTLALALQKFTSGEIAETTLNAISKNCMTFIESYNQSVLQKDVAEIKRKLDEKPEH